MSKPSSHRGGDARTILIVDSDPGSRRILEDLLAHHGHTTIATASGDEALTIARSMMPSLVITELYVSSREHPCLVHALRADHALRHVPIIVFTAFAMPVDREWAAAAEASAFLAKPASTATLLSVFDEVTRGTMRQADRLH